MKILFDNEVLTADITTVNSSSNYPVANLKSPYLRKRYQSTAITDTITLVFDAEKPVSSFFWGYTNLTKMSVTFKNAAGDILDYIYFEDGNVAHYYGYPVEHYYGWDTEYYGYYDRLSNHVYDPVGWHFPVMMIKTVIIDIEGPSGFYLGGLGIGDSLTLPDPIDTWKEEYKDVSLVSEAEGGQVLQQYIEPMRSHEWTIRAVPRADMNTYKNIYKNHGVGYHVWVDPFEENHDFMEPLYAVLAGAWEPKKNGREYDFDVKIREAR